MTMSTSSGDTLDIAKYLMRCMQPKVVPAVTVFRGHDVDEAYGAGFGHKRRL